MNSELKDRVAQAIKYSGLSQIEIAEALGVKQKNISDIVRGVVKNPRIELLIRLAEITKVDTHWLLTGKGEMVKPEPIKFGLGNFWLVPILGHSLNHIPTISEEVKEGLLIFLKGEENRNVFALKVPDNSMVPELKEGDIVIAVPRRLKELKREGEIVAVHFHHRVLVRCLHKERSETILTPLDSRYPPLIIKPEEIELISKVVFKLRRYI